MRGAGVWKAAAILATVAAAIAASTKKECLVGRLGPCEEALKQDAKYGPPACSRTFFMPKAGHNASVLNQLIEFGKCGSHGKCTSEYAPSIFDNGDVFDKVLSFLNGNQAMVYACAPAKDQDRILPHPITGDRNRAEYTTTTCMCSTKAWPQCNKEPLGPESSFEWSSSFAGFFESSEDDSPDVKRRKERKAWRQITFAIANQAKEFPEGFDPAQGYQEAQSLLPITVELKILRCPEPEHNDDFVLSALKNALYTSVQNGSNCIGGGWSAVVEGEVTADIGGTDYAYNISLHACRRLFEDTSAAWGFLAPTESQQLMIQPCNRLGPGTTKSLPIDFATDGAPLVIQAKGAVVGKTASIKFKPTGNLRAKCTAPSKEKEEGQVTTTSGTTLGWFEYAWGFLYATGGFYAVLFVMVLPWLVICIIYAAYIPKVISAYTKKVVDKGFEPVNRTRDNLHETAFYRYRGYDGIIEMNVLANNAIEYETAKAVIVTTLDLEKYDLHGWKRKGSRLCYGGEEEPPEEVEKPAFFTHTLDELLGSEYLRKEGLTHLAQLENTENEDTLRDVGFSFQRPPPTLSIGPDSREKVTIRVGEEFFKSINQEAMETGTENLESLTVFVNETVKEPASPANPKEFIKNLKKAARDRAAYKLAPMMKRRAQSNETVNKPASPTKPESAEKSASSKEPTSPTQRESAETPASTKKPASPPKRESAGKPTKKPASPTKRESAEKPTSIKKPASTTKREPAETPTSVKKPASPTKRESAETPVSTKKPASPPKRESAGKPTKKPASPTKRESAETPTSIKKPASPTKRELAEKSASSKKPASSPKRESAGNPSKKPASPTQRESAEKPTSIKKPASPTKREPAKKFASSKKPASPLKRESGGKPASLTKDESAGRDADCPPAPNL